MNILDNPAGNWSAVVDKGYDLGNSSLLIFYYWRLKLFVEDVCLAGVMNTAYLYSTGRRHQHRRSSCVCCTSRIPSYRQVHSPDLVGRLYSILPTYSQYAPDA